MVVIVLEVMVVVVHVVIVHVFVSVVEIFFTMTRESITTRHIAHVSCGSISLTIFPTITGNFTPFS